MQNFIDTSNIEGRFEFSEWVRAYGKYLDEQLEVFSKIQFYQVRRTNVAFTASVLSGHIMQHQSVSLTMARWTLEES